MCATSQTLRSPRLASRPHPRIFETYVSLQCGQRRRGYPHALGRCIACGVGAAPESVAPQRLVLSLFAGSRAAVETVPREVKPAFAPAYTPVEPAPIDHDAPVRLRLGLQQRAATNLRRHMRRAVRRFAVLVVADLASFYVMRELVRLVRDFALLGQTIAAPLQSALPRGILNG